MQITTFAALGIGVTVGTLLAWACDADNVGGSATPHARAAGQTYTYDCPPPNQLNYTDSLRIIPATVDPKTFRAEMRTCHQATASQLASGYPTGEICSWSDGATASSGGFIVHCTGTIGLNVGANQEPPQYRYTVRVY